MIERPAWGEAIRPGDDPPTVPEHPLVGFIAGDGIGPEVSRATREVIDAAVVAAYGGRRAIAWWELAAGETALRRYGALLPDSTVDALRECRIGLKGPLTTPVGGGFRSVNVALRRSLDLYACVRPIRWFPGLPSPLKDPSHVDLVIFRENTEDVYAGIEWAAGSPAAQKMVDFLAREFGVTLRADSGIGLKSISRAGTERIVRRAIRFALEHDHGSVTIMHKGNIQKHTEGAFLRWGQDLAEREFAGRIVIKDRIADNMFQQLVLRPGDYGVIVAPNLNGDYLSDAAAALVGGLGVAPGVNQSDEVAVFEATHGSAPDLAGRDVANPTSLIFSGAMLLDHIGWREAAGLVRAGVEATVARGTVTADLAGQLNRPSVGTAAFAAAVIAAVRAAA